MRRGLAWPVEPASDQRSHVLGPRSSLGFSEPPFPRHKVRCYSPPVRMAVRIEGDNHTRDAFWVTVLKEELVACRLEPRDCGVVGSRRQAWSERKQVEVVRGAHGTCVHI